MPTPQTPLEGFSFTTSEGEAAAIYCLISAEGFPPTIQGVKAYLLKQAGAAPGPDASEGSEPEENGEDLSIKVSKILDVLERNPEVTEYALKKGAQVLGSLLKRLQ